jgi:tellurite resistance protein
VLLTSKRYLPGLKFAVFAADSDSVISPSEASVMVQIILALTLAE